MSEIAFLLKNIALGLLCMSDLIMSKGYVSISAIMPHYLLMLVEVSGVSSLNISTVGEGFNFKTVFQCHYNNKIVGGGEINSINFH